MITGAKLIDTPERSLVDRSDRRDLSIFQIGLRSIERWLTNSMAVLVTLIRHNLIGIRTEMDYA
jgi:hypothetical protein